MAKLVNCFHIITICHSIMLKKQPSCCTSCCTMRAFWEETNDLAVWQPGGCLLGYIVGFRKKRSPRIHIHSDRANEKIFLLFNVNVLRKERDSNPRRCDPRRFSRPMQSTTLPSFLLCPAKLINFFHFSKPFLRYFCSGTWMSGDFILFLYKSSG